MNKSLYRIVFNRSRNQLMAVAETTGAQGKSASGEASSSTSHNFRGAGVEGLPLLSVRSLGIALSLSAALMASTQVHAMGRLSIAAQTINNTNAGFAYVVNDVAGAGDTVYSTAGGAFYESQGAVPSAPLAFYRTAGTGVQTYTLNPAAGQGWAGGYLIYSAVQYSSTEQRAVVTSTAPGLISSGTAMALDASSQINNDMSQILAGTTLGITGSANINNIQNTVATTTTQSGSTYTWGAYDGGGCGRGRCDRWLAYGQSGYYNSFASSTTLQGNYQSSTARAQSAAAGRCTRLA